MSKATILIVEDEAIVAADLAGKLGRLGYQISGTTGRGEEVVELVRKRRPDLVLMDIRLAGKMDGVEAAEIVRREFDLPVIYLTAHSDRATLERAKLTEPFGYLLKPFEDLGLESHIEMALYKHLADNKLRLAHDELDLRVRQRTRALEDAEKALREANGTLEQRVAERTAELQAANALLSDSRLAALNMMEDAVLAGRQAKEASDQLLRESSERKLAQESLKASEEQFRRAIEEAPIPVLMAAEDGEVQQLSRGWVELTGYTRKEIPTIDAWLGKVCGSVREQVRDQVRELFQQGRRTVRIDIPLLTGDERSRCWSFSASSPGLLRDGRRFMVGMAVDITERMEAETALQRSNQRLDLLATIASQLLMNDAPQQLVDTLCQKVMSFLDCQLFFNFLVDETAERMHLNACAGISKEQAQKIEWLDYGVAVCGCAARDACRIVAEHIPETPDPRTDLVKSFGVLAYACHPLVVEGRVLGTLSFGTRTRNRFSDDDLSLMKAVADQVAIAMERKLAEEELRLAKQAAEAASRTKSQFLANMSHELRTPMTGVLGMLELALQTPAQDQQHDYLEAAQKSGQALLRILNDILDLAKVEAGKFSLDERPFNLCGCIAGTLDLLIPEAKRKGLGLNLCLSDDLPELLIGDQVRVRQILSNLGGNALKFTDQGRIEVQVKTGGKLPDGRLEIIFSVTDTGIGIPDDKQHLLFESFSQVDDSNTRNYGGTGLGLSISKELVERMGGSISVRSQKGQGSTFSVTVPLLVAEHGSETTAGAVGAAPSVEAGTQTVVEHGRLLVAEDDATIRQVLGPMLTRMKYQVDFAEDGQKAVEMWEMGDYQVILMDVQMPKLDGFEATRVIREQEQVRGGHMPIIAMTAHAMKEDEQRCIAAGMDRYISKPIDFRKCIETIKELSKTTHS
jgi:PAS domain S-box-containing protein